MACAAVAIPAVPSSAKLRVVPRRIRVLTVGSQQLMQEGLSAMIDREPDMTVVAAASAGEEALTDVRLCRPDVVTFDLLLPDMPGEELARRILAEFPQIRIVAITSARSHLQARRALDAGIHGYLSKAAPVCELVHAIRQVKAGERVIPGPVMLRGAECSRRGQEENTKTNEVRRGRASLAGNPAHAAVRDDLAESARRTALWRDGETTRPDLERALLPIDVFPRAAALMLLLFERVPANDAARSFWIRSRTWSPSAGGRRAGTDRQPRQLAMLEIRSNGIKYKLRGPSCQINAHSGLVSSNAWAFVGVASCTIRRCGLLAAITVAAPAAVTSLSHGRVGRRTSRCRCGSGRNSVSPGVQPDPT